MRDLSCDRRWKLTRGLASGQSILATLCFRSHRPGDFPFDRLTSRPFSKFLFGQTRGAQFPNEDLFRLVLCSISHERGGLIVLPLIQPDTRIALGQQSQQTFPKRLASKISSSS